MILDDYTALMTRMLTETEPAVAGVVLILLGVLPTHIYFRVVGHWKARQSPAAARSYLRFSELLVRILLLSVSLALLTNGSRYTGWGILFCLLILAGGSAGHHYGRLQARSPGASSAAYSLAFAAALPLLALPLLLTVFMLKEWSILFFAWSYGAWMQIWKRVDPDTAADVPQVLRADWPAPLLYYVASGAVYSALMTPWLPTASAALYGSFLLLFIYGQAHAQGERLSRRRKRLAGSAQGPRL